MSSSLTLSTSDLRSHAVLYKRDAAQKYKWALGATETVTRTGRQPRPSRPSETEFNARRRKVKGALAEKQPSIKSARRFDIMEGTSAKAEFHSPMCNYEEMPSPPADNILNAALAKAVEQYEERETINLIRSEYDVLDADGEVVASAGFTRRKQPILKLRPLANALDVDDDYELV